MSRSRRATALLDRDDSNDEGTTSMDEFDSFNGQSRRPASDSLQGRVQGVLSSFGLSASKKTALIAGGAIFALFVLVMVASSFSGSAKSELNTHGSATATENHSSHEAATGASHGTSPSLIYKDAHTKDGHSAQQHRRPSSTPAPAASSSTPTKVSSLVEKPSNTDLPSVLVEEERKFCQWWQSHDGVLRKMAEQVMGNFLSYLININFQFSEDRHHYLHQLESWRESVAADVESHGPSCVRTCSTRLHSGAAPADGVAAQYELTHAYRQALVKCMICAQAIVKTSDRCEIKNNSPFIVKKLAPARIEEAFSRLYGPDNLPFYLREGAAASFAPYLSLLDTWVYAPEELQAVFPLTDREASVDVASFRQHTARLATSKKPLETQADAGMGGGMGVQLLCKPHKDAPPLLLMSSGGGGGRGYQLDVEPLVQVATARSVDSRGYVDPGLIHRRTVYSAECCNSEVHTCCKAPQQPPPTAAAAGAGKQQQEQTPQLYPEGLKQKVAASQGGGGGIQVMFGPDPITHQHRADLDLFFGGGGGGGLSINNEDFVESHGSQKDPNIQVPQDIPTFRQRLFRDILQCVGHAEASSMHPELWLVGGGGLGGGFHIALQAPKTLSPDPALFQPSASRRQRTAFAEVSGSAEVGMSFNIRFQPSWLTQVPKKSMTPLSTAVPILPEKEKELRKQLQEEEGGAHHPPGAEAGTGAGTGAGDTLHAFRPHEPLFDSSEALASGSADCVTSCLASNNYQDPYGHMRIAAPLGHVTSSSVSNTHHLFYAHCVCPCMQRKFGHRHWASYLACTSLAIGTYDRASRGHVYSADMARHTNSHGQEAPPASPFVTFAD